MAIWKLSLPLFSAKSPDLGSILQLHFIAAARLRTHQYALVCESQPLMTFWCYGHPARCPACGAPNPIKENANANHQG
jgi:hypothetical protein